MTDGPSLDPFALLMNLLLVFLLVAANGFFVAAEFAMVKVRSTRIEQLVIEGNKRARVAQKLINNLDAYLSATQLGITLASLGLGWVGEQTVASILIALLDGRVAIDPITIHLISGVIAFSIITFLHIVLGELAPKSLAIQRAEGIVLLTAWPLMLFYKLMYPFIRLLNGTANRFLRMIGIRPVTEAELAHNEEELRMLVSQSHESGVIDETERNLFDNIFDFTSRVAREIMVPRTDMVTLYAERPFAENMAKVQEDKHTRFPLCIEDKDHIIGIVHIKDLYSMTSCDKTDFDLRQIARKPVTVAEATPIKDVLKILQKNRSEMAIVIDEYGGTAGLLTTEDILEELVGEIQDEFDEERPYIEVHGDMVSIDARMLIEDVNEYFNLNISADEVDTIGGWIYARFENPPQIGAAVDIEGFRFEVSEMDSLRITRLHITRLDEEDAFMIAEMAH